MRRGSSYYDDFKRYGKRSQYGYQSYPPVHRETDEERAARKARERRDYEERFGRPDSRHDSSHRESDSLKRKSHDDRGKSHTTDDSSKRAKVIEEPMPVPSEKITAPTSSQSPAPSPTDIQAIINRPSYQVGPGPATLQRRFPNWCLKGVRFDLDLVPIDKSAMLRNLDAVRTDIERMSSWQKLVDELQRVNRANLEAMLTMENDKTEWQKILKQHDAEMRSIADYNEKLEAEVGKLKEELATSSTSYSQRESVLLQQVRDAHAAQRDAEAKADELEQIIEGNRTDITQLRGQTGLQAAEIEKLKAQLSKVERERDEAVAGRIAAEEAHEATKADIGSTLFDFYLQCILGRGSLAFLGPKYEITLAEVWEAALDMFKGAGYTEEELEVHYLDFEARAALARGKEQLARSRVEIVGEEHQEKETNLTVPVPPSTSADAGIIGSSSYVPIPAQTDTGAKITQVTDESQESAEAPDYEIDVIKTTSAGNSTVNFAQVDCSFISHGFNELLDYFLNLDEPSSPLFTDFNLFSSVEKVSSTAQISPPPVIPPPSLQVAPPSASQPGSQEEQIEALHGLDDPIASQEHRDEGLEGGEISPERTPSDDITLSKLATPGSESSSKRRKKHGTSKRRGKIITVTEGEPEVGPAAPTPPSSLVPTDRPEKLIIRPGKGSKGSKKK